MCEIKTTKHYTDCKFSGSGSRDDNLFKIENNLVLNCNIPIFETNYRTNRTFKLDTIKKIRIADEMERLAEYYI